MVSEFRMQNANFIQLIFVSWTSELKLGFDSSYDYNAHISGISTTASTNGLVGNRDLFISPPPSPKCGSSIALLSKSCLILWDFLVGNSYKHQSSGS